MVKHRATPFSTTSPLRNSYDWQGRLATVSNGTSTSSYEYDGDDLRVTVDGQDHLYDRAGWTGLPELVSTGATAYTHSPEGVISQTGATKDGLLADGLGSIRNTTDSIGAVDGTTTYDVFGDVRTQTGTTTQFGFTGAQQTDNLVYLNARYLAPDIGRFLSVDPARPGAPGVTGYNPYTWVANNPTTWVDPSGQATLTGRALLGATIAVVAVAAFEAHCSVNDSCLSLGEALGRLGEVLADARAGADRAQRRVDEEFADIVCREFPEYCDDPTPDPRPRPPIDIFPPHPPQCDDCDEPEGIYRVWGEKAQELGSSWTPDDPRDYGPVHYRVAAGLPDRFNDGSALSLAILIDDSGVLKRWSLPISAADGGSYCDYPGGGVREYVIPQPVNLQIVVVDAIELDPPYGGRPQTCPDGSQPLW